MHSCAIRTCVWSEKNTEWAIHSYCQVIAGRRHWSWHVTLWGITGVPLVLTRSGVGEALNNEASMKILLRENVFGYLLWNAKNIDHVLYAYLCKNPKSTTNFVRISFSIALPSMTRTEQNKRQHRRLRKLTLFREWKDCFVSFFFRSLTFMTARYKIEPFRLTPIGALSAT